MNPTQRTARHAIALVADDEAILRMDVVSMLEDAGYTVLEAANAAGAIRQIENRADVELLFTDIQMPGALDGIGLAREVGRRWPDVSIIICSGRIVPEAGLLPDHARFISKPCNPALVASAIHSIRRSDVA